MREDSEVVANLKLVRKCLKDQIKKLDEEQKKIKSLKQFNVLTQVLLKTEHAVSLLSAAIWMLK